MAICEMECNLAEALWHSSRCGRCWQPADDGTQRTWAIMLERVLLHGRTSCVVAHITLL